MNETTDAPDVLFEKPRDGVLLITLNRPQRHNAFSNNSWELIAGALSEAETDDDVRCVVYTGGPKVFAAGSDITQMKSRGMFTKVAAERFRHWDVVHNFPKPVIAAVNGSAFAGGLGIVGAVDISIAVDDVAFSFSEVRVGVIPAVISVVCLPKLGAHHGMKLFLTGERFTAEKAVDMGFVHRAVPGDQLEAAVQEEIDMICLGGPNAVAASKKLVRQVPLMSREDGFAETAPWSAKLFASEEAAEGMAAFREKRKPNWVKN